MSNLLIKQALETKLEAVPQVLPTGWENVEFSPNEDLPYQLAYILFAEPDNPWLGTPDYRLRGYMQIKLIYPLNTGAKEAYLKAQALRDTFFRGLSLSAGGVTAIVEKTPEIRAGSYEDGKYVINVFVRFYANILS